MSITTTTNAKIQLSLEGVQQVESGLSRVQGVAGSAAKALAGIAGGVFSAVAFKDWIQGAIDAADETNKLTQKTGLLAEQVAGLKLAFELGGAGDAFATSMARLAKEAVGGNKAFAAMGISVTDANGKMKSTRDLIAEVANEFAGYDAGLRKTALAVELFGKSGADLIPVLNGGAKSFADMDAKAQELGLTISGEMAAASEKFNDDLDLMKARLDGVAISMAGPILSGLNGLIEKFQEGSREGQNFLTTLLKQTEIARLLGQDKVANPYTDTRVELERLNLALASGKLNVTQTYALELKRAELAKKMAGFLGGTANGRQGAEDPTNITRGGRLAPIVDNSPPARKPKAPKAERDEFADLLNRVSMKDLGLDPSFYKDLETLYAGYQKGRVGVDEYREAVEALVTSQKFAQDLNREREQSLATESELISIVAAKELEWAEQVAKRNQSAQQMVDQIQFETSLLGLNSEERERAVSLRELERLGIEKGTEAYLKYGDAIEKSMFDRKQRQNAVDFWTTVDSTAKDFTRDLAVNGEDAFKRWGDALETEVWNMLWQITARKWILQISGVDVGGGGGTNWIDLAQSAYSKYTGGGGAGGLGSLFGGGGAAAAGTSAYGSSYAAGSVSSSAMVSTGSSAAASGSTSMMGYMGYAALIAAAVLIAENLYEKGYNRAAVGYGKAQDVRFGQNTSFTADNSMGRSAVYDTSFERFKSNMLEGLGMSEKWVDILSGTTRMATLFGRKLSAYGYEANIAGGDAEVGGFQRYKGGLFRSNKTKAVDVDPQDAANFDAIVESTIEGARGMARAMGYSGEAIDGYTGKIRVNFKNAKTAEEQAQRMAEAMDNLQFELLKTAAGGKLARDEFKALMEGIQKDIEAAGISTQGMTDILANGIVNGLSGEEIGSQLSQMILGGVYTSLAQNAFAPVAASITAQLITPLFTAMAAGVPIANVISKQAIASVVAQAQAASAALNQVFANAEFQAAMAGISSAISGVSGAAASVHVPRISAPAMKPVNTAADEAKREKEQLERELLRLQGNTSELRRRELQDIKPGNRALQERIWALEDEQRITEQRNDLERQRLEILGDTVALRNLEREALDERNRALYDEIQALQDAANLKDVWTDLTGSIEDEIKRIRADVMGESLAGVAYAQAQFATLTAQTRALDKDAAAKLPDIASQLSELFQTNSASRSEFDFQINSMLASLEETNRITRAASGITEAASAVEDKALAKEVKDLNAAVVVLQGLMEKALNTSADTTKILTKVTSGGNAMRTTAA